MANNNKFIPYIENLKQLNRTPDEEMFAAYDNNPEVARRIADFQSDVLDEEDVPVIQESPEIKKKVVTPAPATKETSIAAPEKKKSSTQELVEKLAQADVKSGDAPANVETDIPSSKKLWEEYTAMREQQKGAMQAAQLADAIQTGTNIFSTAAKLPQYVREPGAMESVGKQQKNVQDVLSQYVEMRKQEEARKGQGELSAAQLDKIKKETLMMGQLTPEDRAKMAHDLKLKQMELDQKDKKLTVGQASVDRNFAKDYDEYVLRGGFADVQKSMEQLREVQKRLGGKENLSGYFSTAIVPGTEAANVREAVEEIVQRNLRLVLGAQFTEKEGERLISRAYQKLADESENKKRVDRLIKQIEQAASAKQAAVNYYEENGTLSGFKGKLPTVKDFDNAIDGDKKSDSSAPTQKSTNAPGTILKSGGKRYKVINENGDLEEI